ncbi:four-carbon acid sugar kinase family protein [Bosea psychrotolerans]|uniref:Uncharacterized protein YgbK (DUF1537 family) n=1 Tax=Bosea psychrotolerans TaxID=1871628 RepID=A0A2S4LV80_9HYPH|nr:four-carbon acid sugar kinase family protein [Bosea psychrotolerans]POR46361.1 uncharacterized protein YgbK (DUF1537 family) [Bosea psychrotolerans]
MTNPSPLYGWYGDDFTGATDTLSALAEQGRRALLFLRIPTPEQLSAAGPLDAIGIAGATRSMEPVAMAAELDAAGRFFAGQGVALLHYKCCSTFDSAPLIGSIGAAVKALRPYFQNPFLPIIGGQPNLGRYCLFGNLFAAAGIGGVVHRIDRHPTMSVHPVTPMAEADLRRHLTAQGLEQIALLDYRNWDDGAEDALTACLATLPGAVLLDVARASDLPVIGKLIAQRAQAQPMLAVGPSSVAQALAGLWGIREEAAGARVVPLRRGGPVLALVGSLSPVTRAQVEVATGFAKLAIEPRRLLDDEAYVEALRREALRRLAEGHVMLITERPSQAPENAGGVAAATGLLLRGIIAQARLSRLVVAGGDTSSLAVKSLDIWGLSYRGPLASGAPLCRTHSDDPRLDDLDIVLKGGQMGPVDFFARATAG